MILDIHSEAGADVLLVCSLQWPAWRLADAQASAVNTHLYIVMFLLPGSYCPFSAGEVNL